MEERRFIIWDPRDGNGYARWDDAGNKIISDGVLGRIGIDNVYLTAYPEWPELETRRPRDLGLNGIICGVKYRLSGESGEYDIIRVV